MAVITLAELKAQLKIDGTWDDFALEQYIEAADIIVAREAPDAPASVKKVAAARFCGWMYDTTSEHTAINGWQNSGAASLLKPHVIRRAGIV